MPLDNLQIPVAGHLRRPSDHDYAARCAALLWNARAPDVTPAAIVEARDVDDVRAAVRAAAAAGLRVSPRGSGHNWSGVALQDGLVLDLKALGGIEIDEATGTAEVGPAVTNGALAAALADRGFAFPVGHCADVSLSGYLLGGGFGWNSGEWGMACHGVEAAEVVTADGAVRRAGGGENPDLFWALRGGGPAFFGVVTRYRLRLRPLRPAMMTAVRTYPIERAAEVARWMEAASPTMPAGLEHTIVLQTAPPELRDQAKKVALAVATVFADAEPEALAILERLGRGAPRAPLAAAGPFATPYEALYGIVGALTPRGARYVAEGFWAGAAERPFAAMAAQVAAAPSDLSYALGVVLPPGFAAAQRERSAFSSVGGVFGCVYGVWTRPEEDAENLAWLRRGLGTATPSVTGYYVGEADLARPGRLRACFDGPAWRRLDVLRRKHDPAGLFARSTMR